MYKTLRLRPLLQRTCRRARSSNTRSSTTTTATTATAASRTTAATPSESVSPLRRAIAGYEAMLETSPILTKSATGGVLYGIGDSIAQTITRRQAVANGGEDGGFDTARWLRAVAFGGIFYPLPAHIHYNFLERFVVVRMATPASRVPFVKMFIEQFVYWSYFSNAYYHAVLGALQGMSVQQVCDRVTSTLWDTLKAQWAFWIPAQLINFKYVPVRHQLNFVLVVSLGWTTFLSLAFPPTPEAPASSSQEAAPTPTPEAPASSSQKPRPAFGVGPKP